MATRKRRGQHTVKALVRVYSDQAVSRLLEALSTPANGRTSYLVYQNDFKLVEIVWRPRPSLNEWNTESDWRRMITNALMGLYYDVLIAEYSWRPVEETAQ